MEAAEAILVVDDEGDIRLVLEDILAVRHPVYVAVDGRDALEKLAAHPDIGLVLTDLCMPRLDGMELLQQIRRHFADIGVVIISAHGAVEDAVRAMQRGAFDYITKPLPADFGEIYARIERYFSMRRLRRQQVSLQEQIRLLARFPRSNPHFVARAVFGGDGLRIYPGNERARALLEECGGAADADGSFAHAEVAALFPADFARRLQAMRGSDEIVEVERVPFGERYFHHTYTPFVDDREQIFVNLVDITRQVESEALRAMLEAGMEHEFKNHLMAIAPNAEMLHSELLGPLGAEQKQAARFIIDAGNALLDSLNQRLEFSRAYSGRLELQYARVDLYELVRKSYEQFRDAAGECLFKLEGRPFEAPGPQARGALVECDPSYVQRVLNNLVGNAVKHSPWVDVRVARQQDEVRLEVADGGEGMDAEDRAGIWTLGYRAKNRKGGSTGIGLPYSKLIVEAHGGHIGVQSTPGQGSIFYFSLPLCPPAAGEWRRRLIRTSRRA